MRAITKIAAVLAGAALASIILAGCTAAVDARSAAAKPATVPAAQAASDDDDATPTLSPTPQTPCEAAANPSGISDTGPRQFANGEVTLDSNGYPVKYTVAPGDADGAVVERLCINLTILGGLNQGLCPWATSNPQPGDVWNLDPLDPVALHRYDENDC